MKGGLCIYTSLLTISVLSSFALFVLVVSEVGQASGDGSVDLSGLHNVSQKSASRHKGVATVGPRQDVDPVDSSEMLDAELKVQEMIFADTLSLNSVTTDGNHGISPLHQVLLALRFYALGTMLVSVADFIGVSIASASRIVSDVSKAIAKLYPNYVLLQNHTQVEFYNIAGFPRVHGCIDGTHILIQSPNSNIGEEFRNRKGIFSINVQVVCNASLMFLNVVARWPGSAHDVTIFNHSDLKDHCELGQLGNRWLLGDSGYPCKPYLLTPLINPNTPSEQRYNESHIKTRNTVERCIGVWKRRFPVLALKMRLKLENMQAVIIATAVLHNIARSLSLPEMESEISIPETSQDNDTIVISNSLAVNTLERQLLVNNYFNI